MANEDDVWALALLFERINSLAFKALHGIRPSLLLPVPGTVPVVYYSSTERANGTGGKGRFARKESLVCRGCEGGFD